MKTKLLYSTFFLLISAVAFSQLPIVNGWTQFTASSDTRIIYVSDTDGDDATAEFYTSTSPEVGTDPFLPSGTVKAYKTISAAKNGLRNGFPDWILLKKGDVFTNQAFGMLTINAK